MKKELSPHATTILALINNASELSVVHHNYVLAKDVVISLKKVCEELGFEVDAGVFRYILEAIGNKPPIALKSEFDKFAGMIIKLDRKLDKEPLASDYKYVRPVKFGPINRT